jgi:hypothetical protein
MPCWADRVARRIRSMTLTLSLYQARTAFTHTGACRPTFPRGRYRAVRLKLRLGWESVSGVHVTGDAVALVVCQSPPPSDPANRMSAAVGCGAIASTRPEM